MKKAAALPPTVYQGSMDVAARSLPARGDQETLVELAGNCAEEAAAETVEDDK